MRNSYSILCAIGFTVCLAAANQDVPTTLSSTLRDHVKNERFEMVTSIRGLPLGVRGELQTLFGTHTLDIADPGAEFQATDVIANPKLPTRRLVAAGCSNDHCVVHYERGGRTRAWLVALFHWTPAETRVEWGGNAPSGFASFDEVRSAVLSGAIKGPVKVW